MSKIEPINFDQCQAEVPNGHTFMTMGGRPGRIQCTNAPLYILREVEPGDDGQHGHMSLCESCFGVFKKQMPDLLVEVWQKRYTETSRPEPCPHDDDE